MPLIQKNAAVKKKKNAKRNTSQKQGIRKKKHTCKETAPMQGHLISHYSDFTLYGVGTLISGSDDQMIL